MSTSSTFALVVRELGRMFEPLERALDRPETFVDFMAGLGWDVATPPPPIEALGTPVAQLSSAVQALIEGDPTDEAVANAANSLSGVVDAVRALRDAPASDFEPQLVDDGFLDEFPEQLLQHLLADYLRTYHDGVAFALGALGILRSTFQPESGHRLPYFRDQLDVTRLGDVLEDPSVVFRNAFGWGTDAPDFELLFGWLDDLFTSLDVYVERETLDDGTPEALNTSEPTLIPRRHYALHFIFFERKRPTTTMSAGIKLLSVAGSLEHKPGLALMPYFSGILGVSMELGPDMLVTLDADFDAQGGIGVVLRPDEPLEILVGFASGDDPSHAEGSIRVRVQNGTADRERTVLLGAPNGTRVDLVNASSTSGLRVGASGNTELYSEFELQGGRLVIGAGDGDSFVKYLLGARDVAVDFDLTIGASTLRGFYFRGSTKLDVVLPASLTLGPIDVTSIRVGVVPSNGGLALPVTADVKATLGPVGVSLSDVGLVAELSGTDEEANLGIADLGVGFRPPSGLGLDVDAGPVVGGGFVSFDGEIGRYAGALELSVYDIALKAIGLLDTRLPGGTPPFSFVALASAEFSPIPLGLGFTLNGVGGLIGIERRASVEALGRQLRNGELNHLLFSEDPVTDAATIVSDLAEAFPPAAGRTVFGPMAKIGWGPSSLVEADIGLVLELPDPVRLLLLGSIRSALPSRDRALVDIRLDVLGELDFDRQRLALDGHLVDSHVVGFSIEGDMALRLSWGDDQAFALSIGGFHPDFHPPAGFPAMQRITVPIGLDDDPRITLQGYLAFTSNTLQVGASADLYASAGWFNITGGVDFDALFQFSPFRFVADFSGRATLRKGETDLAGVSLSATIEGPAPWRAAGEACLVLKWLPDPCVGFDKSFGGRRDESVGAVDPWPLLQDAAQSADSYAAVLPAGARGATAARGSTGSGLTDPAAGVTFRQSAVPLHRELTLFGGRAPAGGPVRFDVQQVRLGGATAAWTPVTDRFAPAQFEALSDPERLSRPSFEPMDAGFSLGADAVSEGPGLDRVVDYETRIVDSRFDVRVGPRFVPVADAVLAAVAGGSASGSPLRTSGPSKFASADAASRPVSLAAEQYTVASSDDLTERSDVAPRGSKDAALSALRDYLDRHPDEMGRLQVVSTDELVAA